MQTTLLQAAITLHQQGRLHESEVAYRQVLANEPNNADAHALLACVLSDLGHHDAAFAQIQLALNADPKAALFHFYLGNIATSAKDLIKAEAAFVMATELAPQWADAWYNRGNAARALTKDQEAHDCYMKALALNPQHGLSHNNLALLFLKKPDLEKARAHADAAMNLAPMDAQFHQTLSDVAFEQNDHRTAFIHAAYVVELRLGIPGGNVAAIMVHDFVPDDMLTNALLGLSVGYMTRGLLKEASALLRLLLSHDPEMEEALSLLGSLNLARNQLDMADEAYAQSFMLDPSYTGAPWNRAMVLLTQNHLSEGFRRYRWRWHTLEKLKTIQLEAPMWDGGDLNGKTLLVHEEQGFGDSLQMLRFMPALKARGATVWVYARKPILPLLQGWDGIDRAIEWDTSSKKPPEGTDLVVGVMDLPGLFNITPASLPAEVPYLPNPKKAAPAADLASVAGKKLRVGLVWSGNPLHKRDHERSIPLSALKPLMDTQGVTFFSLQFKPQESDLHLMREWGIIDLNGYVANLADSASLISQLDLLITVDSAPAHLAGGLGVNSWVLVTLNPDWRWLLDQTNSPWYPTIRLFRQNKAGNWGDTVESVKNALFEQLDRKH